MITLHKSKHATLVSNPVLRYPERRGGKLIPVRLTYMETAGHSVRIAEYENSTFKVDTDHVLEGRHGVVVARMVSHDEQDYEGVLIHYPDKTKHFLKGENVYEEAANKHVF